jgi:hypothetical protein
LDEMLDHDRDLLIPPERGAGVASRGTGVPPVFDAEELSTYTQSNEAVSIFTTSLFHSHS